MKYAILALLAAAGAACTLGDTVNMEFAFLGIVPDSEALAHQAIGSAQRMQVEGHFVRPCSPYRVDGHAERHGDSLIVLVKGEWGTGCPDTPDTTRVNYRVTFFGLGAGAYGVRVTHDRDEATLTSENVLLTTEVVQ